MGTSSGGPGGVSDRGSGLPPAGDVDVYAGLAARAAQREHAKRESGSLGFGGVNTCAPVRADALTLTSESTDRLRPGRR